MLIKRTSETRNIKQVLLELLIFRNIFFSFVFLSKTQFFKRYQRLCLIELIEFEKYFSIVIKNKIIGLY